MTTNAQKLGWYRPENYGQPERPGPLRHGWIEYVNLYKRYYPRNNGSLIEGLGACGWPQATVDFVRKHNLDSSFDYSKWVMPLFSVFESGAFAQCQYGVLWWYPLEPSVGRPAPFVSAWKNENRWRLLNRLADGNVLIVHPRLNWWETVPKLYEDNKLDDYTGDWSKAKTGGDRG